MVGPRQRAFGLGVQGVRPRDAGSIAAAMLSASGGSKSSLGVTAVIVGLAVAELVAELVGALVVVAGVADGPIDATVGLTRMGLGPQFRRGGSGIPAISGCCLTAEDSLIPF
jgi:hypothetical protein